MTQKIIIFLLGRDCRVLKLFSLTILYQLTFIILAGISAGMYFLFLSYMIWRVFCNISVKRASLPSMSSMRRLHYEGIIYRFKFLMLATLLCAAMTVIGFILNQVCLPTYSRLRFIQY